MPIPLGQQVAIRGFLCYHIPNESEESVWSKYFSFAMAPPELASKYPLKPRKTAIFEPYTTNLLHFRVPIWFLLHRKQSRRRQKPPLSGLLFVCMPFSPKPVFPADKHIFCGTGRYQGWQDMYNLKNVCLPWKQVLDEMADKQKAVPEEADLVPLRDCFCCSIVISELENVVNL